MYRDKIVKAGFSLVWSSTAEEGLMFAKKEKPDLIILDILLPQGNGIYFLKKVREDPDTSSIPVIAFSNFDDPKIKKEAFELGVKDYLIKTNYTPQDIIDKINYYLNL